MEQITVFTGPNRYAIHKEKTRWVQEFRKRQGDESLTVCPAKNTSFAELHNECQVAPFLAEKRLMVVDGMPARGKKGDAEQLQKLLHPSVLLLFLLPTEPNKKSKPTVLAKELMESSQVQEFPMVSSSQLQQWIEALLIEEGATGIEPAAKQRLLEQAGEDQALLETECKKLSIYAFNRTITVQDVENLMVCSSERDVWKLMDFLGAGNVQGAMEYAYRLLDRGYSPQALWSTFLWMISLLTQIVAISEEGESNPWKIAGSIRANPYSVKAILPFATSLDRATLRRIINAALQADIELKTGVYKATAEAPQELLALIDRSLMSFSR